WLPEASPHAPSFLHRHACQPIRRRLPRLVVTHAAFFNVASTGVGIDDSHGKNDMSRLLQESSRRCFSTPFRVRQGVPPAAIALGAGLPTPSHVQKSHSTLNRSYMAGKSMPPSIWPSRL